MADASDSRLGEYCAGSAVSQGGGAVAVSADCAMSAASPVTEPAAEAALPMAETTLAGT